MKRYLAGALLVLAALWLGCKGQVTVDEAYNAIRPVKQLELPDQVEENVVIIIENVADPGSSYKNRLDLYINDHKISPDWLVSNVQNDYIYRLRMRPGYYDLKAYYYAYVGWGEDKYEIKSEELVRVQHDKKTVVRAEIVKRPNGEPVNKTMYFTAKLEDFAEKTTEHQRQSESPGEQRVSDTVMLQINTVPEHAQIIIDDKVVGQSPLRYEVSRSEDHILQISAAGYRTKTKFVDHAKVGSRDIYHVVQELEKE
ncbi:PEGA domain-containing protein [candidate division KSB1 bacterium]|nr:PEGA domain-containing protein [candidate division KSB1 bacterium]RQW11458.1 MAG: PEGA domain-containing protein [candidate division KSB1 bacterium]